MDSSIAWLACLLGVAADAGSLGLASGFGWRLDMEGRPEMTAPQTLEEALPCTCVIDLDGTPGEHDDCNRLCIATHRPAIQAWHEAEIAKLGGRITEYWREERAKPAEALLSEKDARIAELEGALSTAIGRLDDMLQGDDGQAWKETERAMPKIRAALPQEGEACGTCGGSGEVRSYGDLGEPDLNYYQPRDPCPDCGEKP